MFNKTITAGNNLPDEINVIIEIPAKSSPIKYELDKNTGVMFVDRFISTPMFYPCDYGFVPHTLSDDGDPVDVLVIAPYTLMLGCVIKCRPVGMLQMRDESGIDAKIIAVPIDKLTKEYSHIKDIEQVGELLKNQIEHFFANYKNLETGKWVEIDKWYGAEKAKKEIVNSFNNANK